MNSGCVGFGPPIPCPSRIPQDQDRTGAGGDGGQDLEHALYQKTSAGQITDLKFASSS